MKCPKCGNMIMGEDPKGDGIYIDYYCEECEENLEDMEIGNPEDCKHRKDVCKCPGCLGSNRV